MWNVAIGQGDAAVTVEKLSLNSTVAVPPDQPGKLLLTGTVVRDGEAWKGQLRTYDVANGGLKVAQQVVIDRVGGAGSAWLKGLSLFTAQPGAAADRAALLVSDNSKNPAYTLEVYGPGGERQARVPLWSGTNIWPVVATSRQGRHIAVGGSPDHRILVFPITGVLANEVARQEIRSVGTSLVSARFASRGQGKGKEIGLILEESPVFAGGKPESLTFNFNTAALTVGKVGWRLDELGGAGWSTDVVAFKGKDVVRVFEGNKVKESFAFDPSWFVQAHAVVPPGGKNAPDGLLIVALFAPETADTVIELYGLKTRDHVLRFSGHYAPIRSLSLSADGRLLASAANDQTVCVWSLTELVKPLGQVGGAPGLAVTQEKEGNPLVVAGVSANNKGTQNLQKGMLIEGLMRDGKLRKLTTPDEFYDALWASKPGTKLTLRAGKAGQMGDVAITVGQGTAIHKPLLTLFVTRPDKGRREWVGWSPSGLYEASSRPAESYLGWHFNTGKPAAPTSFAPIDQARDKYYKKGIVNKLIAHANLADAQQALAPPPPPLPVLAFAAVDAAEKPLLPDAKGQLFVRSPSVNLLLTAEKYEKPDAGDVAEWQFDGGKAQPLTPEPPNRWSAKLELPPGKASLHTVEAAFRRRERPNETAHSERLTLRYQPPKPSLKITGPLAADVDKPGFSLAVMVSPGAPGVIVDVTIQQDQVDKMTAAVKAANEKIGKEFTLKEGKNRFKVWARNRGALVNFEDEETDELTLEVTYAKKQVAMVARPEITLEPAVPLALEGERRPLAIESGRKLLVSVPKLQFLGTIKGKEDLAVAAIEHIQEGQKLQTRALKPLPSAKQSYRIEETVSLKPGLQTVRFRAKTANSPEATREVHVHYRPLLPITGFRLKVVRPEMEGLIFRETEQRESRPIDVVGDLSWPKDRYDGDFPLNATALLDNEEAAGAKTEVSKTKVSAQNIPLAPGDNRIRIRLTHTWGGEPSYGEVHVRYIRPPQLLNWEKPAIDAKKPFAGLTARIWSPTELRKETVKVSINGKGVSAGEVGIAAGGAKNMWLVTLKGVPLTEGQNKVRLRLRNAEAESRDDEDDPAKAVQVAWMKPARPPSIAILSPAGNAPRVGQRDLTVEFRVDSAVPLRHVALWRDDQLVREGAPEQLNAEKSGSAGHYEYKFKVPAQLEWRENTLRVEATNDGGQVHQLVPVSAVRPLVRVAFDQLTVPGPGGPTVMLPTSGSLRLEKPAPGARVWVEGKVIWPHDNFKELKEKKRPLRFYVNGFQQTPVELQERVGDSLERKFKAPVVLSQAKDNFIKVKLPGLEYESNSDTELLVDCAEPDERRVVHVVVIAPKERDAAPLQQGLKTTLDKVGQNKLFKVQSSALLTRESSPVMFNALYRIHKSIKARALDGFPTNDLVLVYFQGAETIRGEDHYLWTARTGGERDLEEEAINLRQLAREFDDFLGAQVVLMDAETPPGGTMPPSGRVKNSLDRLPNLGLGVLHHSLTPDTGSPNRGLLVQEVEKELPGAARLWDLTERLRGRFGEGRYVDHLPPGLDMRLASSVGTRP